VDNARTHLRAVGNTGLAPSLFPMDMDVGEFKMRVSRWANAFDRRYRTLLWVLGSRVDRETGEAKIGQEKIARRFQEALDKQHRDMVGPSVRTIQTMLHDLAEAAVLTKRQARAAEDWRVKKTFRVNRYSFDFEHVLVNGEMQPHNFFAAFEPKDIPRQGDRESPRQHDNSADGPADGPADDVRTDRRTSQSSACPSVDPDPSESSSAVLPPGRAETETPTQTPNPDSMPHRGFAAPKGGVALEGSSVAKPSAPEGAPAVDWEHLADTDPVGWLVALQNAPANRKALGTKWRAVRPRPARKVLQPVIDAYGAADTSQCLLRFIRDWNQQIREAPNPTAYILAVFPEEVDDIHADLLEEAETS
jgi:hypothetical protein